ncbi:hypothetical protein ACFOSD_12615 [Salinispirillum marinum]|uniref:Uncharacterized protein n=2 Tax=Saccharospirillaceae TaxID=255527 RepID=A0ABV8BIL6_9GAMM
MRVRKPKLTSAFTRVGMVFVLLGVIALPIDTAGLFPKPSIMLLPLGVCCYIIGWYRDRKIYRPKRKRTWDDDET